MVYTLHCDNVIYTHARTHTCTRILLGNHEVHSARPGTGPLKTYTFCCNTFRQATHWIFCEKTPPFQNLATTSHFSNHITVPARGRHLQPHGAPGWGFRLLLTPSLLPAPAPGLPPARGGQGPQVHDRGEKEAVQGPWGLPSPWARKQECHLFFQSSHGGPFR